MSWTYQNGANPPIDWVRLLIPDTNSCKQIFSDEEIRAFTQIQAMQFQSGMRYTAPAGANLPVSPVSYLRVAALVIDAIANNAAQLSMFVQVLDVKMDPSRAAEMLAKRADQLRKVDDESGAFVIIEQCLTWPGTRDRWWAQIQRQSGL